MLRHAAEVWDASEFLSGEILDVGCGLGGGSIFWAAGFGAQVTAVTCVPSHADHVARFAAEAGLSGRSRRSSATLPRSLAKIASTRPSPSTPPAIFRAAIGLTEWPRS